MDNQEWDKLLEFFDYDAQIYWPNTNERFSVEKFVEINRNYPGDWRVNIKKILNSYNTVISVVGLTDGQKSLHAISFFYFVEGFVASLEEYWSEDGSPPDFRT